jgi:hypothetical protein
VSLATRRRAVAAGAGMLVLRTMAHREAAAAGAVSLLSRQHILVGQAGQGTSAKGKPEALQPAGVRPALVVVVEKAAMAAVALPRLPVMAAAVPQPVWGSTPPSLAAAAGQRGTLVGLVAVAVAAMVAVARCRWMATMGGLTKVAAGAQDIHRNQVPVQAAVAG